MTNVLTRAEVKTHLNIATTDTTYDTELDSFTARAESAIANRVGPLAPTTGTESHDGGTHIVRTLYRPIQTITSITESYGAYNRTLTEQPLDGSNGFNAYGYTVDRTDGVVVRRVSGVAAPFAIGRRNVTVAYTYGWSTDGTSTTLPADLDLAVLELIRAWWEASQRGGTVAPGRSGGTASAASVPADFPAGVEQLLQPFDDYGIG